MRTPFAAEYFQTKTAFWGGALGGAIGIPQDMGQRAAVRASPRELTDEQYNRAVGGFDNAAATAPRELGHGLVGAGLGAGLGALGAEGFNLANSGGDFDSIGTQGNVVPAALYGAAAGGAAGLGHGAYTAGRDFTRENIENIDAPGSVSTRHPVATNSGRALSIAGPILNPTVIPGALLSGAVGHAGSALIGRSHSNTFKGASALPEHFVAV